MTQFKPKTLAKKLTYMLMVGSFLGSTQTQAMTFSMSIENETDKSICWCDEITAYSSIQTRDPVFSEIPLTVPSKKKAIFNVNASVISFIDSGYIDNPHFDKDGIWFELVEPGHEGDAPSDITPKIGIIFDDPVRKGSIIFKPLAKDIPEGYKVDIRHSERWPLYHIVISKK